MSIGTSLKLERVKVVIDEIEAQKTIIFLLSLRLGVKFIRVVNAGPLSRTALRHGRFKKIEEICDIVRRKNFFIILGVTMWCSLELVRCIGHGYED